MTVNTDRERRPFSTSDKTIILLQAISIVVIGALALLGATDPDWGDLQRLVILMMLGVWVVGLVVTALLARLIENRWFRYGVLLAGPFAGIIALVVAANT